MISVHRRHESDILALIGLYIISVDRRHESDTKKKTTAAYMLRTRTKKTVNEYMIWTRTKKTVTEYTRRTRTKKMTDSGASFTTLFGFRVFTWWSFFCSSVYA
jgi:hypothetical protein